MCRIMCQGVLGLVLVLAGPVPRGTAAADTLAPAETLKRYLAALKAGQAEAAYDHVSKAMRGGKSREIWAKEQKEIGSLADVKIFGFTVGEAKIEGETAKVPNVLESQDKFINQMGLTEYELYTLVREDGQWRVDQQVLVEPPDMPKWFPKLSPRAH